MKKVLLAVVLALLVFLVPVSTTFGTNYFLFDKESNKILFMGENDIQFTEKIDIQKNPDRIMPTDDPDRYLGIYVPEVKKGKEKDAQQGQLIIYNIATGRTEDLVDLGYGPFYYTYTKDYRHFFISYRPTLSAGYYELLHYNIPEKTTERLADLAQNINYLVLSYDETAIYVLIPGEDKKTPGKIQVISYSPFAVSATIPTEVNPRSLFILDSEKLVLVDADETNKKQSGALKMIEVADYSVSQAFKFEAPYKVYNYWYQDDQTLFTTVDAAKGKSFVCKTTFTGIKINEIDSDWFEISYAKDIDSLFLLGKNDFRVIDYGQNEELVCKTGSNVYDKKRYTMSYIPEMKQVIVYCPGGGKVKFIDLAETKMIKVANYGRASAKFGNFMANLIVSVALTSLSYNAYDYGYYTYSVNMFKSGTAVSADSAKSRYYIMRHDTRDITVFEDDFAKVSYLVPEETPITMYQIKKPKLQSLVITGKKIYLINSEDLVLKPIHEFKETVKDCLFLEEENRLILITDRNLLIIDPASMEIKNDFMLYGNPEEKYTRIKKGEQRYYFIREL